MLKLCEVMESDVQDYLGRHQNGSEGQNEADAKYPILTALLPALRIYCMWIAARRSEIFTSDNAPTNVVPPMARSLARVLTFLCAEIHNLSDEPASCPYLLPEDIETRGLQALNDDQIPAPCRSYCTEDGNLKPHPDPKPENLDAQKAQLEAQQENIARILDLLRSAYFLAEDPTVPLTCGVVDGQVAFQYQPDGVPNDIQSNAEVDRVPGENARGNLEPSEFNTNGIVPNQAQTFPSGQPHSRGMEVGESSGGPAQRTTDKYLDTMNDADKTVVNMLSPFLDCPSPQPEPGAGSPYEPSYGMHSTTANEIAQELLKGFQPEKDDPAPHYESLTPGKFGSSTWNYFFTPTTPRAHVPESTGQGSFLPGHRGSNHSSHGSVPMAEAPEDPFTTPARRAMADWQPPTGSNMGSATGSPAAVPGNQLLQAPAPPTIPRRQSFNNWSMNANPNASSWSANTIRSGPSTGQAPNPWGPHARAPAGALASSVPSTGQTPNSWAPQAPANAPAGAPASSVPSAFSHPSSLYQGTPKNGVSYGQPTYASVGKNGVHNGATQGNASPASRHFQMDQTASSYDAAIFQAAIQDSK